MNIIEQEPDKANLVKVLDCVNCEWRRIGIQLKIEYNDLENIQDNVPYNIRLSKVLQLWIEQRKREVSWDTIITIIKNPPLNNANVANRICHFLLYEYDSDHQGIQLTYSQ